MESERSGAIASTKARGNSTEERRHSGKKEQQCKVKNTSAKRGSTEIENEHSSTPAKCRRRAAQAENTSEMRGERDGGLRRQKPADTVQAQEFRNLERHISIQYR
ncbi:hypothetical protein AcW1_002194 [Taiwanofungus camphoratus]|nr:hypothetical protein AcW1_002194 [Antrodia cinnamomea]